MLVGQKDPPGLVTGSGRPVLSGQVLRFRALMKMNHSRGTLEEKVFRNLRSLLSIRGATRARCNGLVKSPNYRASRASNLTGRLPASSRSGIRLSSTRGARKYANAAGPPGTGKKPVCGLLAFPVGAVSRVHADSLDFQAYRSRVPQLFDVRFACRFQLDQDSRKRGGFLPIPIPVIVPAKEQQPDGPPGSIGKQLIFGAAPLPGVSHSHKRISYA